MGFLIMEKLVKANRHFGIVVSDLENSLKFYCDVLGFKIFKSMTESGEHLDKMLSLENVNVKTVKMTIGGDTLIELLEYQNPHSGPNNKKINDLGASHLALTVYDLEKTYKVLKNIGIRFTSPPQTSPDGNALVTFCFDPDNTPIELVQVLN